MRKISSQTPLQQRISLGYPQDLLARTSTKSGIFEDLDRIPTRSPSKNLIQQDCPDCPNVGPNGPNGPDGPRLAPPDGPDGPDGPNGLNGPNGPNPAEDHGRPKATSSSCLHIFEVPFWNVFILLLKLLTKDLWREIARESLRCVSVYGNQCFEEEY